MGVRFVVCLNGGGQLRLLRWGGVAAGERDAIVEDLRALVRNHARSAHAHSNHMVCSVGVRGAPGPPAGGAAGPQTSAAAADAASVFSNGAVEPTSHRGVAEPSDPRGPRGPRGAASTPLRAVIRKYNGIYFAVGIDADDDPLYHLALIPGLVKRLDASFNNVCEVDLVYNVARIYNDVDKHYAEQV